MNHELYDLTRPPPAGDPLDRVMRRVSRNRRRRTSTWVTAVVILGAATFVPLRSFVTERHPAQVSGTTSGVVPFAFRLANLPSTAPPIRDTGKGLPACEAKDLTLVVGEAARGPRGAVKADVTATNTGVDCSYTVSEAHLATAAGQPVAEGPVFDDLVGHLYTFQRLEHGAALGGTVTWTNWCGPDAGAWRVLVTLGRSTTESAVKDGSAAPTCTFPNQLSFVSLSLAPVNEYGQPIADPQQVLLPALTGPSTAPLGSILKMTLRVTNPSRGPVSLDPCPQYVLGWNQVGQAAASPTLLLNCPEAPNSIAAGGHVDFALELPITPALSSLGKATVAGTHGAVVVHLNTETDPLPITVLPDEPPVRTGSVDCLYGPTRTDDHALSPPSSEVDRGALPRTGVISTSRGELKVEWSQDTPCSLTSLLDTARHGFWNDVPGTFESDPHFPVITFSHTKTAGYLMREEIRGDTTYPVGTVLFVDDDPGTHGPDQLRIVLGPVPYPPLFTVVGHITSGMALLLARTGGTVAITGIR
ncbi:MAG: peptidylprolyl isomerase [Frankiales bacterium]|nr:peptidylprolyl isomerase [Frankiales bacterium]